MDIPDVVGRQGATPQVAAKPRKSSPSRVGRFLSKAGQNPRWAVVEIFSRFAAVRSALRVARRQPAFPAADSVSMFDTDPVRFAEVLEADGFALGLQLPPPVLEKLKAFALSATCYGDADLSKGFKYLDKAQAERAAGRKFSQARYYFPQDIQGVIDSIVQDPVIQTIVARHIKARPCLTSYRMWWTFPAGESYNASLTTSFFHYDKDDFAALRFFFYLTDVSENDGPHAVVRGSHTSKKWSQLFSLGQRGDAAIESHYGKDRLAQVVGRAGAGFAEDPFCFHKATRPLVGDRLMLQLAFALRDINAFPPPDPRMA